MNSSLEMLEVIAGGLQDLLDEVVFVGGATVALYQSFLPSSSVRGSRGNSSSSTSLPTPMPPHHNLSACALARGCTQVL